MTSPRGALYRLDPDGTVTAVLREVTVSNGIAWDAAGEQMFYIDSATQRVDVFDYDTAAGRPLERRPLAEISPADGMPDGLALDAESGIWVALWKGSAVRRYGAGGRLDAVIELPADLVTACAFGGDDLSDLFITTSRMDLEPGEQPAAGAVFIVRPGVRGLATGTFAG
jgi:sugar lactone lactonase YvrE